MLSGTTEVTGKFRRPSPAAILAKPVQDIGDIARSIVDSNRFMTLATADASGLPWASPVWYAPRAYRELFWASSPEARHSRNLAERPELALVIYDSHEPGTWKAVYMSGVAEQVPDVDEGIEVFARRSVAQGLPVWTRDDVLPPAKHRLYRAIVHEWFVLDDHDERLPVTLE
jgi:nitroimidazol reductase NimA-like FMN-containing flavoprotein (pyridoxamine 5'-phosphate oxidase superfamily)